MKRHIYSVFLGEFVFWVCQIVSDDKGEQLMYMKRTIDLESHHCATTNDFFFNSSRAIIANQLG